MRKIQMLCAALLAVFAVSAAAATSAMADQWLFNGLAFTGELAVETKDIGGLILGQLGKAAVSCEGSFIGTVTGGSTEDLITEVLDVNKNKLSESLASGTRAICKGVTTCENNSEAWPLHLPWLTIAELMSDGRSLDLFASSGAGLPGWEINCLTFGGLVEVEETCEGETSAIIKNTAAGVEGEFEEKDQELEKLEGKCGSEEQKGFLLGKGVTTLVGGGAGVSFE